MARKRAQQPRKKAASKVGKAKTSTAKTARKAAPIEETVTAVAELPEPTNLGPLVLPETLDSACAITVKNMLLERRGSPLVVDAGQVRRTGMQAVQILIAAARTWQADGQSYAVTNPSSEFLDTITLVGLTREQISFEGMAG
ncbi:MAG: STAS domain-containing protein [Proteobacteria bacterium]|nr:STAS domain-containing protein [Pseudomonadota bacterium]